MSLIVSTTFMYDRVNDGILDIKKKNKKNKRHWFCGKSKKTHEEVKEITNVTDIPALLLFLKFCYMTGKLPNVWLDSNFVSFFNTDYYCFNIYTSNSKRGPWILTYSVPSKINPLTFILSQNEYLITLKYQKHIFENYQKLQKYSINCERQDYKNLFRKINSVVFG